MDPKNLYYADFGIEGTVSAVDEYSSIPMSKFTNMRVMQGGSWKALPSSAALDTPDKREGYMAKKCGGNSMVAGTVTALDCGVIAISNSRPDQPRTKEVRISTAASTVITLDASDFDKDYLIFRLVELPRNGATVPADTSQRIPNSDGDSAKLVYRPSSSPPKSDTIKYSVTDGRQGHVREGLITIRGSTPAVAVPDPVDDFAHTLSGNRISFTWSHPDNGGSAISFYKVERSPDASTWSRHSIYTPSTTGFTYDRFEGYDQYFRIFASNRAGASPSSNIVHVHIPDTTPPELTIRSPSDGATVETSDVTVLGTVREPQNSGIEDIRLAVDGAARNDPISLDVLSDSIILTDSTLSGLENGRRTITMSAANGDGYSASTSVGITVDAPVPMVLGSFLEDFEGDMSRWVLASDRSQLWAPRTPSAPVPGSGPGNTVAGTDNCDDVCTMTMLDHVDLSGMADPKLRFHRYVATGADTSQREGITVSASADGGRTWAVLERLTADNSKDDGAWHLEEYGLGAYSSSSEFQVRFEATSSSSSEDTEVDDVRIYDAGADTPPAISAIANVTMPHGETRTVRVESSDAQGDAISLSIPGAPGFASLLDGGDGTGAVTLSPGAADVGTHAVTVTAATGLASSSATFAVEVFAPDTAPPEITAPPDIKLEATAPLTPVSLGEPEVSDDVDPDPSVSNNSTGAFPVGTTVVEWTATDASNNTSSDTQAVTVRDTTKPKFRYLPFIDPKYVADSSAGAVLVFAGIPLATDIADPDVRVVSSHRSGDLLPPGTHTITFSATDDSGNTLSYSFGTTVVYRPVDLLPVPDVDMAHVETREVGVRIAGPGDYRVSLTLQDSPRFASIRGDGYGTGVVTLDPSESDTGSHTVTVLAHAGYNFTSASFGVVVRPDAEPPSITAPADVDEEATAELTPVDLGTANASDADPDLSVSNDAPPAFPLGTTAVTWNATDSSGNTATAVQLVTIRDTKPPSFTSLPPSQTHAAGSPSGAAVSFAIPEATDAAGPDVQVASSHRPGGTFPVGVTVVTFNATDGSGNSATHSITITVTYDPPSAIQNLRLGIVPGGIAISWDPLGPDSKYQVKVFPQGKPGQKLSLGTSGTSHTVTGLDTGTTYKVTVHAKGDRSTVASMTAGTPATHAAPTGPARLSLAGELRDIALAHTASAAVPAVFSNPGGGDISYRILRGGSLATLHDSGNGTVVITLEPDASHTGHRPVLIAATSGSESVLAGFAATILEPPAANSTSAGAGAPQGAGQAPAPAAAPAIRVIGDDPQAHEAGSAYEDPGAVCDDGAGRASPAGADLSGLDAGAVGRHVVGYACPGTGLAAQRAVDVVDTTPPVIELAGLRITEHPHGERYADAGAVCTDNHDPDRDISTGDSVRVKVQGAQPLRYLCADSSGNEADAVDRIVIVLAPGKEPMVEAPPPPEARPAAPEPAAPADVRPAPEPEAAPGPAPAATETGEAPQAIPGNSTIVPPPDVTTEATGPLTEVPLGEPAIPPGYAVSNDAPGAFPLGTTVVAWVATGAHNATHAANQTVTVLDTSPPVLSDIPGISYGEAAAEGTVVTFGMPSARDLVDGDVPATSSREPGSVFPPGNSTITFAAADLSGNEALYVVAIAVEPGADAPTDGLGQDPGPPPEPGPRPPEEPRAGQEGPAESDAAGPPAPPADADP